MKKLINAKILIVGGAGFVGSNLVFKLLNYKIKNIFIIDNLLSADASNVPKDKRVIFLKGSVTNQNILKRIPKPSKIVDVNIRNSIKLSDLGRKTAILAASCISQNDHKAPPLAHWKTLQIG